MKGQPDGLQYIADFLSGTEQDLYAAVEDQAKLIVLSSYDAGRLAFKTLFPKSFREGMKQ